MYREQSMFLTILSYLDNNSDFKLFIPFISKHSPTCLKTSIEELKKQELDFFNKENLNWLDSFYIDKDIICLIRNWVNEVQKTLRAVKDTRESLLKLLKELTIPTQEFTLLHDSFRSLRSKLTKLYSSVRIQNTRCSKLIMLLLN